MKARPVRDVLDLGWQQEGDLLGFLVRVFLLGVLKLHVGTELVPRDRALRRPVDLLEERVDLRLLQAHRHHTLSVCAFCKHRYITDDVDLRFLKAH